MRSLFLPMLAGFFTSVDGWMTYNRGTSFVRLSMATNPDAGTTDDPCWQDLYDDDCHMSSVYSASFVAGKWIKSMPCAKGLDEDCDMGDLDVPEARPEAGVDNVDVMDFLGLKKAESLSKAPEDDISP